MPIQKKEKLKEKVYATVKSRILNFELKPGEKFFETEISADLGMSRTPVREALNRLEHEGLIKSLPNRGYSVSDVTSTEIEELYEIREALEVLALKAAAANASSKDWLNLEKTLRQQTMREERDTKRNEGELFRESHEFHQEIARLSGKETLTQMIDMVSERINRFQWMNLFLVNRAEHSRQEHMEIIRYLKQGKIEEALAANQKHIHFSRDTVLNLLHRKKDLLYIG
ncbi:MAG TPA: GntR family transcriptional regulator [Syntrophorhabdaceae bacterium]|nr:GntR family transcriptional regulator [Syntrophorhabdaceae bacterium]